MKGGIITQETTHIVELATIITSDGEVYEIPDLPEDMGYLCFLASAPALARLYDTPEEDAAWNHLADESASN